MNVFYSRPASHQTAALVRELEPSRVGPGSTGSQRLKGCQSARPAHGENISPAALAHPPIQHRLNFPHGSSPPLRFAAPERHRRPSKQAASRTHMPLKSSRPQSPRAVHRKPPRRHLVNRLGKRARYYGKRPRKPPSSLSYNTQPGVAERGPAPTARPRVPHATPASVQAKPGTAHHLLEGHRL